MIEEVVGSILEAEDVAAQRIAQARAQAAEIVAQAQAQADALRKQRGTENRQSYERQCNQGKKLAQQTSEEELQRLTQAADQEVESYAKNTQKAIGIILENF